MICLLTSEINKTTTSCLESCYDFFLWSVPVALTPCASFVAKDALDLQGLKVSMVSTDTSRFTFGCGASMCVATDVLQLPQAPPEEPLQKRLLPGVLLPLWKKEYGQFLTPNRGVPHPTVLTSLSHCFSFLHANFLQSNFSNNFKICTNVVTEPSLLL